MTTSNLLTPTPGLAIPRRHLTLKPPSDAKPANGGRFNVGKIGEVDLDLIPKLEDCNPGLRPVEYNLIVAPAKAAETMGALGLIRRSEQDIDTEQLALQIGRIVAMSPLAFNYEAWNGCEEQKPKVGDVVWFARYAGGLIEAAFDGKQYRIIKDKDVAAVVSG